MRKTGYKLRSVHVQQSKNQSPEQKEENLALPKHAKSGGGWGRQKRVARVPRINPEQYKVGMD